MAKYRLTEETKTIELGGNTYTLHRIKAMQDIPARDVNEGDLGGWVEDESCLSQHGDAWIADDACACNGAFIYENACLCDRSKAWRGAKVYGNALIKGQAEIRGAIIGYGSEICGTAVVAGDTYVASSTIGGGNVIEDGGNIVLQTRLI